MNADDTLEVFQLEQSKPVRLLRGEDGGAWFVYADLYHALGFTNWNIDGQLLFYALGLNNEGHSYSSDAYPDMLFVDQQAVDALFVALEVLELGDVPHDAETKGFTLQEWFGRYANWKRNQQWREQRSHITERQLVDVLVFMLDALGVAYMREVRGYTGRVDIKTSTALFEAKIGGDNHDLKHAVGQLLVYQQDHPTIQKLIVVVHEDAIGRWKPELVRALGVLMLGVPDSPDKVDASHLGALQDALNVTS